MNLLLAVMLSKQNQDDACVWYLINCLLDTFIGVIFEWALVRLIEVIARRRKIETLVSGCYYSRNTVEFDDLNIDYSIWAIQAGLWCIICCLMKLFIYAIMLSFPVQLENFGIALLQSVSIYPRLELIIVMVIVPFILNCIQVIYVNPSSGVLILSLKKVMRVGLIDYREVKNRCYQLVLNIIIITNFIFIF
jgi:hypothetical protein